VSDCKGGVVRLIWWRSYSTYYTGHHWAYAVLTSKMVPPDMLLHPLTHATTNTYPGSHLWHDLLRLSTNVPDTFYTLSIRLTPVNTFSLSTLLALTDNALDTTHQRVTSRTL